MPGRDNTGPMGMGRTTGRAAGNCAGHPASGVANGAAGGGRGFGRGRGRGGHGRRNRFRATGLTGWQRAAGGISEKDQPTAAGEEQELDVLKRQAEGFATTLEEINNRIAQLETQSHEA